MNFQPLSIFLVKKGQGGDRLLFRYPYKVAPPKKPSHNLEPVLLLNGASSAAGNVSNSKASSENVPTMSAAGKPTFYLEIDNFFFFRENPLVT